MCDHELSREIPMALLEAPRRYRQGGGRKTTAYRCNIIVTQYNNFADPAQNTILPGYFVLGQQSLCKVYLFSNHKGGYRTEVKGTSFRLFNTSLRLRAPHIIHTAGLAGLQTVCGHDGVIFSSCGRARYSNCFSFFCSGEVQRIKPHEFACGWRISRKASLQR